jgi:hypothetical protein
MENSIQGLQMRLFIKSCLLDDILIKKGIKKQQTLRESFLYDQIIGSTFGRLIRIKNRSVSFINNYI